MPTFRNHHLRLRRVRRSPLSLRRLGGSAVELAQAQLEAEAQAASAPTRTNEQPASGPGRSAIPPVEDPATTDRRADD